MVVIDGSIHWQIVAGLIIYNILEMSEVFSVKTSEYEKLVSTTGAVCEHCVNHTEWCI